MKHNIFGDPKSNPRMCKIVLQPPVRQVLCGFSEETGMIVIRITTKLVCSFRNVTVIREIFIKKVLTASICTLEAHSTYIGVLFEQPTLKHLRIGLQGGMDPAPPVVPQIESQTTFISPLRVERILPQTFCIENIGPSYHQRFV